MYNRHVNEVKDLNKSFEQFQTKQHGSWKSSGSMCENLFTAVSLVFTCVVSMLTLVAPICVNRSRSYNSLSTNKPSVNGTRTFECIDVVPCHPVTRPPPPYDKDVNQNKLQITFNFCFTFLYAGLCFPFSINPQPRTNWTCAWVGT